MDCLDNSMKSVPSMSSNFFESINSRDKDDAEVEIKDGMTKSCSVLSSTLDDGDEQTHFIYKFNVSRRNSFVEDGNKHVQECDALLPSWFQWFNWMRPFPEKDTHLLIRTSKQLKSILNSKFGSSDIPVFLPIRLRMKLNFLLSMKVKVCDLKQYPSIPNREHYMNIFNETKTELELYSDTTEACQYNCSVFLNVPCMKSP